MLPRPCCIPMHLTECWGEYLKCPKGPDMSRFDQHHLRVWFLKRKFTRAYFSGIESRPKLSLSKNYRSPTPGSSERFVTLLYSSFELLTSSHICPNLRSISIPFLSLSLQTLCHSIQYISIRKNKKESQKTHQPFQPDSVKRPGFPDHFCQFGCRNSRGCAEWAASSRLKRQRFTDFTGGLQKFTLKNLMLATYIYMYIRKIQTQK
jgi:hypothetical protein